MNKKIENIVVEGARIIFRNFSGKPETFSSNPGRHFGVIIEDEDTAEALREEGWNVKTYIPKNQDPEEEVKIHWIDVKVSYDVAPPVVRLVNRDGKARRLEEESLSILDDCDILSADVTIRPYHWAVNGKEGIKGYLKTLYMTLDEDEFAYKYDVED